MAVHDAPHDISRAPTAATGARSRVRSALNALPAADPERTASGKQRAQTPGPPPADQRAPELTPGLTSELARVIAAALDGVVERAGSRLAEPEGALLRRLGANARALLLLLAGGAPLRPAPLDLGDVLMGILPDWQRNAPRHSFELALPGSLPSVIADAPLVEQALGALLATAVHATPRGATVRVTLRTGRDAVVVGVTHDAEWPAMVGADPFAAPDDAAAPELSAPNAALDLTLARVAVERHGGLAWWEAQSEARSGTPGAGQRQVGLALLTAWPLVPPVATALAASALVPAPAESAPDCDIALPPLVAREQRVALLVEADARMGRFLRSNLEAQGYRVALAANAADARREADRLAPDLALLDGEPAPSGTAGDGVEPLRALLAELECPIIVLAHQNDPLACARALDLGAADWIARPFSIEELLARVRATLRRQPANQAPVPEPIFTCGALAIDFSQRQVTVSGVTVALSKTEYKLLRALAQHPGKVLGHELLLERVWGPGYGDAVDFLWVYVRRLRRKVELDPARPRYILTVPGVGYRLAPS